MKKNKHFRAVFTFLLGIGVIGSNRRRYCSVCLDCVIRLLVPIPFPPCFPPKAVSGRFQSGSKADPKRSRPTHEIFSFCIEIASYPSYRRIFRVGLERFQSGFRAVSEQFQSNSRAISEEFQSNSRAIPEQFQGNSRAVPEQIQSKFRANSEQFQSNFRAIPKRFQSGFRAISEQIQSNFKAISEQFLKRH